MFLVIFESWRYVGARRWRNIYEVKKKYMNFWCFNLFSFHWACTKSFYMSLYGSIWWIGDKQIEKWRSILVTHTEVTLVSHTLIRTDSGTYGSGQLPSQFSPGSIPTCGNSLINSSKASPSLISFAYISNFLLRLYIFLSIFFVFQTINASTWNYSFLNAFNWVGCPFLSCAIG